MTIKRLAVFLITTLTIFAGLVAAGLFAVGLMSFVEWSLPHFTLEVYLFAVRASFALAVFFGACIAIFSGD